MFSRICPKCGNVRTYEKRRTYQLAEKYNRVCSISCAGKGRILSEEHKEKLSEIKKGIPPSKQCIEASRKVNIGAKRSEETRRKLSESHKGIKPTKETIEKRKKSLTGKRRSPEFCKKLSERLTGRTVTKETRAKISKSLTGKKASEETRAKLSKFQRGKVVSEKTKELIRVANLKNIYGDNIPDLSNVPYTPTQLRNWALAVKKRDNFKCQVCFKNKKLEAHHKKQKCTYPELALDTNNGITLCHDCHMNAHKELKEQQNSKE